MPDTFHAYDDAGRQYTVVLTRRIITGTALDGSNYRLEGTKSYRLSTGQFLNMIDDTTFEIVASGVLIRTRSQA